MNYLSDTNHTGMWLKLRKPFAIVVLWAAIAFASFTSLIVGSIRYRRASCRLPPGKQTPYTTTLPGDKHGPWMFAEGAWLVSADSRQIETKTVKQVE